MADWQEGDVAVNPQTGEELVLSGNKWVPNVSTVKDIAQNVPSALGKGVVDVGTLPYTISNLVAKGANTAGNYFFPDWKSSLLGQTFQGMETQSQPYTAEATKQRLGLTQEPVTTGGKIASAALEAAPLGVLGGGSLAPNIARALLSGGASEAAGQATAGTPLETPARLGAGALAYAVPGGLMKPAPISTPRGAMVDTLENQGVKLSTADATGSRVAATLEGHPPANQVQQVSDALIDQSGIVRTPGDNRPFGDLVADRIKNLRTNVQGIEARTSLPFTPQVDGFVTGPGRVQNAKLGSTLADPEIQNEVDQFHTIAASGGNLNGTQYINLRDKWNNSGNPTLRAMADRLDQVIDTTNPNLAKDWNAFRDSWADAQGIKAASDAAGGKATTVPLDYNIVANGMYRKTPMYRTAEAAQGILGSRSSPYNLSWIPHVLAGAGGIAGFVHGGSEPGLAGAIIPEAVGHAVGSVAGPLQAAARSVPVQRVMRNMDPRMVAALLARPGANALVPMLDETQGQGQ